MPNECKLRDIFEIEYGNQLDKNKLKPAADGVNFISRSSKKLGFDGKVEKVDGVEPYGAGLITVTLGGTYLLSSFVQNEPFYTGQNIKVLSPREEMTFAEKVFYCLAISRNRFRYTSHGREANKTLDNLSVPSREEVPGWVKTSNIGVADAAPAISATVGLSDRKWLPFKYSKIFDIKKGRRLTKANMKPGNTPFIGAIDFNNGHRQYVDVPPEHEANTITVNYNGNGVAEAFYQPTPFWASDDVNVLYPRFDLSPQIAMFLCTLIRKEKYRFSYGRKWGLVRMSESVILLPVTATGEPDWAFMERYIKSLPYSKSIAA